MVMERLAVAVSLSESVTCAVNGNVPETVGVPLSCPLLLNDIPVGSAPVPGLTTLQVYGATPPVAVKLVAVYATFSVPAGNCADVVVMDKGRGAPMVTVYACVPCWLGLLESVTWIVKATLLCCVVGVPLMVAVVPLVVVKPKPAGSAPALTLHE